MHWNKPAWTVAGALLALAIGVAGIAIPARTQGPQGSTPSGIGEAALKAVSVAQSSSQQKPKPDGQDQKAAANQAKGDVSKGKDVFANNCATCHNADSSDALVGPGLKGLFHWPPHKLSDGTDRKEETVETVRKQITDGGGDMPPMGSQISDDDLNNLIAYLQTL